MRLIFLVGILSISSISYSQTQEQKDSIVSEICKTIIEASGQTDSIRINKAYEEHLYPFMDKFPLEVSNEIGTAVYFRLQRNCREFKEILDRADPSKGDWSTVEEKPFAKLSQQSCRGFMDHIQYSYIEATGDTVQLRIEDHYWKEAFKDGTYSSLKISWVSDCEFDIEFIESNNTIRKHFSKPGDRYRYQIVDKKEKYYEVSLEVFGSDKYLMFKIYYEGTKN